MKETSLGKLLNALDDTSLILGLFVLIPVEADKQGNCSQQIEYPERFPIQFQTHIESCNNDYLYSRILTGGPYCENFIGK
ncbi:MAG: hypothetical protein Ct9H300mP27_11600 [Chloroflexota bacterium]|nr:MAG: hypothetical protein Ct9H300mP27_11600 [Chloroflexota bacterium]